MVAHRRRVSIVLCLSWGAMICWMSLIPSPPEIQDPLFGWDKFQHGAAYALLALLSLSAFASRGSRLATTVTVVFGVIMFGGVIELAQQQFTVNRTADPMDFMANTVGAVAATLIYRLRDLITGTREEPK